MNTRISKMLVCGADRVAALTVDGRVLCHGAYSSSDEDHQVSAVADPTGCNLTTQVVLGLTTSVTIDAYGNLSSAGTNDYNQARPVADWKGQFVDVVSAFRHTVGLRKDGTVVACGWKDFGQCDVSGWKDITAIDAGLFHTLGLRFDGTVVGCGSNDDHQLDVGNWKDIIAITCSDNHSVGLKSDGTVVACGTPKYGACAVSNWQYVVKVICGSHHTVGLKIDGTVVACGANESNANSLGGRCDVQKWTDVKDIVCSDHFTLGLRNDGTVLFTGANNNGVADVLRWRDIVHIVCNELAVFGLKRDGTVVTCGTGDFFTYHPVNSWKLFDSYETVDEDFQENLEQRMAKTSAKKVSKAREKSKDSSSGGSGCGCFWILIVLALIAAGIFFGLPLLRGEKSEIGNNIVQQETEPTTANTTAIVRVGSVLNMRAGPGVDKELIATIPDGTEVIVHKTENNWAYVNYNGHDGWCSMDYLEFNN